MKEVISSPLFGVLISLVTFEIGLFLNRKFKKSYLNPLLISMILIITLLLSFGISYEDYNKGGQLISFFLGPATIILAVPLYSQLELLKKHAMPILVGIIVGTIVGIICIITLSHIMGLDVQIANSLAPKSVTTPIGVEISKTLNGIPSITVVAIIFTGIFGSIIGEVVFKTFKVKHKISKGVSLGTAAHAIGTTKAIELGEIEGAMSSLSIGIAGLLTVFLAPLIVKIISMFL